MYSTTFTNTETFTITHAKHMGAKVAADLMRFRDFYGKPTLEWIDAYEREIVALLKGDYINHVIYGFYRDGRVVEGIRYKSSPGGVLVADEDPGKLRPKPGIAELTFSSYLVQSDKWQKLSADVQRTVRQGVGFDRVGGAEPGVEGGYWLDDRTYSAGGRSLSRSSIRRW